MARPVKTHVAPMLEWIQHAIDANRFCPTNDEIAERFNYSSPSAGSALLKEMEARGLIAVQRFSAGRVVTIVATGKSTATPRDTRPHWRDRDATGAAPSESDVIGNAPVVPITTIAEDDPPLAAQIIAEAKRQHRPLTSFLSQLVSVGWLAYRADQLEGGA